MISTAVSSRAGKFPYNEDGAAIGRVAVAFHRRDLSWPPATVRGHELHSKANLRSSKNYFQPISPLFIADLNAPSLLAYVVAQALQKEWAYEPDHL